MLQFQLSVYGFFELRRRRTDRQTRDICSTGSDVCSCGLAAGTAIADAAQNLKRKKISIKTLTTIRTCTRDKGVRTVGMGLFRKPPPFCQRIIRDGRAGGRACTATPTGLLFSALCVLPHVNREQQRGRRRSACSAGRRRRRAPVVDIHTFTRWCSKHRRRFRESCYT